MLEQIKELVNRKTGVDIDVKSRKIDVVEARSVYFRLCREFTKYSNKLIAKNIRAIKKQETVQHSYQMSWQYMTNNERIKHVYLEICDIIKYYNKHNCINLVDAENKMPLKVEVAQVQLNNDLVIKKLEEYTALTEMVLTIPKKHLKTVEERLKVIIHCLPK